MTGLQVFTSSSFSQLLFSLKITPQLKFTNTVLAELNDEDSDDFDSALQYFNNYVKVVCPHVCSVSSHR